MNGGARRPADRGRTSSPRQRERRQGRRAHRFEALPRSLLFGQRRQGAAGSLADLRAAEDCIAHLRRYAASGRRRITFRISTMGDAAMAQLRRLVEEVLAVRLSARPCDAASIAGAGGASARRERKRARGVTTFAGKAGRLMLTTSSGYHCNADPDHGYLHRAGVPNWGMGRAGEMS